MKIQFRRSQITALALAGTLTMPFLAPNAQAKPSRDEPIFGFKGKDKDKNRDRDRDDRDRDNRADRNVRVFGTVARDLAGNDRFTVKLDDGRTTEVISRDREPFRLSKGDRVELRGDFERGLFIADSVRITDNRGNGGGNGNNGNNDLANATRLEGRVTRDDFGRVFEILTEKGARVRVRTERAEPIRLSRGDLVEVLGRFQGQIFVARDVNIQRNEDRQKVDFPGIVLRRSDAGRIVVRADNGRTYQVISNLSLMRFGKDDRVRVKGFVNRDIVAADSVVLLRDR